MSCLSWSTRAKLPKSLSSEFAVFPVLPDSPPVLLRDPEFSEGFDGSWMVKPVLPGRRLKKIILDQPNEKFVKTVNPFSHLFNVP